MKLNLSRIQAICSFRDYGFGSVAVVSKYAEELAKFGKLSIADELIKRTEKRKISLHLQKQKGCYACRIFP